MCKRGRGLGSVVVCYCDEARMMAVCMVRWEVRVLYSGVFSFGINRLWCWMERHGSAECGLGVEGIDRDGSLPPVW